MRETYLWVKCRWVHAWLTDDVFNATPRHRPTGDCTVQGGMLERLRNGARALAIPESMVGPAAAIPIAGGLPSYPYGHIGDVGGGSGFRGNPVAIGIPDNAPYPYPYGAMGLELRPFSVRAAGATTGFGSVGFAGPDSADHPQPVPIGNMLGVFLVAVVVLGVVKGRKPLG